MKEPSWLALGPPESVTAFGQFVFLRGLVTKDGLFPARGCRDSILWLFGHWILSPSPGSLKAQEWGCQQVSQEQGPWQEKLSLKATGQAVGQDCSGPSPPLPSLSLCTLARKMC